MTNRQQLIKTQPRLISWAVLLLLMVGVAVLLFSGMIVKKWVTNKPERPHRPQVVELPYVETVAIELSENRVKVRAGGFVSAKNTASISAQVSGKVISISPNLEIGQRVKKGEVLVQLGTTDYKVALTNAKANLATANANYKNSQASLASANAQLVSAKSSYEQAKGQSRQAARDVKSLGLKATDLNLKKPQLNAAKAAVDSAKANIENAKSAIDNSKAAIDSAKAQVTLTQTNLNRTTITAPFDAVVQGKNVAKGEVANSSKILATLVATDVYTVKLTLDSQSVKQVKLTDNVTLVDTVYNRAYEATLSRFAPNIDTQNRTLAVYVDIANPLSGESPLLLDSYLNAVIDGARIPDSAMIPDSAIVNRRYVWAKNTDDTIARVPVHVVYRETSQALVTFDSSITELITRPKDSFIEGQKVTTSREVQKRPQKGSGKGRGQGKGDKEQPTDTQQPKSGEKAEQNTQTSQRYQCLTEASYV